MIRFTVGMKHIRLLVSMIVLAIAVLALLHYEQPSKASGCEVFVLSKRSYWIEIPVGPDSSISKWCEDTRYVQMCEGFVVDEWEEDTCALP